MKQFDHVIRDELGMHARPAGRIAARANKFESNISIIFEEQNVNAKEILNVMGLEAKCGDTITFTIEGSDECNAYLDLQQFVTDTW